MAKKNVEGMKEDLRNKTKGTRVGDIGQAGKSRNQRLAEIMASMPNRPKAKKK